ncbi:MAG: tetratricopeptide repeat protein [Planctomycetes bacterium]|nr:tetratricopeptide repeat protein [Planctomycetota bacterium]
MRQESCVVTLALALLLGGCGSGGTSTPRRVPTAEDVPRPVLDDAGAPVVKRITLAREAALRKLGSASAWGDLGIALDAHGFPADATACYEMAANLAPDIARWPYLAATVLVMDEPEQAIVRFERAAEIDPGSALVRHAWGVALLTVGRDEEARRRFDEALERDGDDRRAILGLAELASRRDDFGEAAALLDRAARLAFHDRSLHAMLARLHRARSEPELAARAVLFVRAYPNRAAEPDPHRLLVEQAAIGPKAHTQRGLALAALGMNREAERAFRLSLDQRPASRRNRLNLAGVLARQGRRDEALALLDEILATTPDEPDVHNHLAVVLMDLGRLDEAAEQLATATRLDASHDGAHSNLGRLRERTGQADDAIEAYRQAIELNPVNHAAHAGLARLLAARGDHDAAMGHWRDAADFGRDAPEYVVAYAMAASRRGAFADASTVLHRALRTHGDDVPLLATAVTVLATCPDPGYRDGATAVRLAERLVKLSDGRRRAGALELLAVAQAESGDFVSAVRTGERALELARAQGNREQVLLIESRLALYRAKRPYHQPGG